uniref:Protein kinase domain-containing protein n=2 Tax=Quercus lobata TaxID=97700 RepID=A0A7N2KLB1_QUELO
MDWLGFACDCWRLNTFTTAALQVANLTAVDLTCRQLATGLAPHRSEFLVDPIVVQIDRLDLVQQENSDLDAYETLVSCGSFPVSMARGLTFTAGVLTALIAVILVQETCSDAADVNDHHCPPSSCGNIHNISYPFRLKSDPEICGDSRYELSCENNRTTVLYLFAGKYHVQEINYNNYTIRVVDSGIWKDNYFSFPMERISRRGIDMLKVGRTNARDVEDSCKVEQMFLTSWPGNDDPINTSCTDAHNELLYGFELSWLQVIFNDCYLDDANHVQCEGLHFAAKNLLGSPCVIAFFIYKWRRRHLSMCDAIENFLQSHNNLMPIRYSYSQIKKMTKCFKDKLGEGGYGSVYKGKLQSGHLVAIKMLGKSKGNGQEFINKVATIGRIHHENVVQLIGYCVEGLKRALIYEFMPNGSLDKYIFSQEGNIPLSIEKTYNISLGVAHGIEYLHRGCDMQILHFDIKPHNILLDENFTPKVSDFGLAKLYPIDDSTVSLTAARGTLGYIAPELFYKNIGGVSYKAGVYSFGMLLLETASKRKNLNAFAEHSSQIYFPTWVYGQFNEGNDIEMEDATEEEKKTVKKMIIVALWCIQMKPSDHPSMNKVIEMLEGEVECLQMPSKPFLLSSPKRPIGDVEDNLNSTSSSIQ